MSSHRLHAIKGWDHLELYVGNAKQSAYFYERAFGFTQTAYSGPETGVRDRASYVLDQNGIRLVVTSGLRAGQRDHTLRVLARRRRQGRRAHGSERDRGVPAGCAAGRESVVEPHWVEDDFGRVELAAIATYGENIHTFVNRDDYAGPYLPGYTSTTENGSPATGIGLQNIDHVVGNVELGRMEHWVEFYERAFGMTELIHFSDEAISTEYSALMSKVMMDGEGKIKFPINEPAEGKRKSQIEEYLDFYGGPGVQHVALATEDIVGTVQELEERGLRFLKTPTRTTRTSRTASERSTWSTTTFVA